MSQDRIIGAGERCTVITDWVASYCDPIALSSGEPVALSGRRDHWDEHLWLWARSANGTEGWVPECLMSATTPPKALEDYDARELTCQTGQVVTAERILQGWAFCRDERGRLGWVPMRNLA